MHGTAVSPRAAGPLADSELGQLHRFYFRASDCTDFKSATQNCPHQNSLRGNRMMPGSVSIAIFAVAAASWQQCLAYPSMAGSCNGVFGKHLPNTVSGDGGYRIGVNLGAKLADGSQSAAVSVYHTIYTLNTSTQPSQPAKGSGYYKGLLLRSFDPNSGSLMGSFLSPLPANTMLYEGCSSPSSAISHDLANSGLVTTEPTLNFNFSWPARRDVAFQLFVVESTKIFYQLEHTVQYQVPRHT